MICVLATAFVQAEENAEALLEKEVKRLFLSEDLEGLMSLVATVKGESMGSGDNVQFDKELVGVCTEWR